jgi:ribosomal protein RSM22 (predicted rRNA methylase)
MGFPADLRAAIEQETAKLDRRTLARSVAELTQSYKSGVCSVPAIRSEVHRAAYLATRLPATYAACHRVMAEIQQLAPQAAIESMLDLGAGPGTALWAAAEVFPNLTQATMVESDDAMVNLGRRIAAESMHPALREAQWKAGDLTRPGGKHSSHDLVVISYVLGELTATHAQTLVAEAWRSASRFFVIIEPGTPRGFSAVIAARTALIAAEAQILAPCPNCLPCPMAAGGDWCHFSERIERTSLHRQLKGGALAYEDEKFSYLVACRQPVSPTSARIVRHPRFNPGHVQLTLCSGGRIEHRTVTRSQREEYKLARRAEWGDTWIG